MIEPAQAFWLALVQGLTEFLPVSSSAHLVLLPILADWPDQGLAFDVAVHVGTLIAVVVYLRHDLVDILSGWLRQWGSPGRSEESHLGWLLIVATVPAVLVGLFVDEAVEALLRDPLIIAGATIAFALLLWWADRRRSGSKALTQLGIKDALLIGMFQALALVPGTSRSGITITAGLMLGLSREAAARFSFLMAVPIITAAGSLKAASLIQSEEVISWGVFALGVVVAFFSAWAVIALFLRFINRVGMTPFVLYRIVLGSLLLIVFW
ncbi:MAG TPA: undecaprenyl-diphosphatase [Gammaproteobacteria bacterium]|jgi:undecaprenyl-diphosphatase|nr:undecaprenyl-diphosphatase [Acidiferrobacteraceae bacterium]MDP6398969.1 undecaprenyl-diphosphate phosphatase [Arenicellales bacterium]HCX87634.1 undecaprenyl-diphosphatase [Gammaproteobacteria bacterium]MDP6550926.1 undecaprenyl-diphosphate phosphatase [Arenicellales bacterium]MDP6790698.1 undecaprenyl-diphosphate phosphatase [Arenicellales bacterium]|tara:strand:+ start:18513 stop:19313 length:801 start_codon:yes stop_codon:yes gene_type:complete